MPSKFKKFLLVSLISFFGAAHADDKKQDVFQVQVLKNASVFSNSNTMLTVDGEWAKTSQFLRSDQVSVDCAGGNTKAMKGVERIRGTYIEARRDADTIKAVITIKDFEPQNLPTSMEKCVPVIASEQVTKKVDLEFKMADVTKGEFTKDIGDGYSIVFTAARILN